MCLEFLWRQQHDEDGLRHSHHQPKTPHTGLSVGSPKNSMEHKYDNYQAKNDPPPRPQDSAINGTETLKGAHNNQSVDTDTARDEPPPKPHQEPNNDSESVWKGGNQFSNGGKIAKDVHPKPSSVLGTPAVDDSGRRNPHA